MKRFLLLMLIICSVLLFSCDKNNADKESASSESKKQEQSSSINESHSESESETESESESETDDETSDDDNKADDFIKYNYDMSSYIFLPDNLVGTNIDVNYSALWREIDQKIVNSVKSSDWLTTKDYTAKEGDIVEVSYSGYYTDGNGNILLDEDGNEVAFSGGTGTSTVYIGSRMFILDFEKGLIGMQVGKQGQFYATFPENYGVEDLNGATVIFKATINKYTKAPEFNLDFIRSNFGSQYESIDDFIDSFMNEQALDSAFSYIYNNAIILSYPDAEQKLQADILDEMAVDFEKMYGISLDTYLKYYMGYSSRDEYIKQIMKKEMVYYGYARLFNIKPNENDIENAKKALIEQYKEQYFTSYPSADESAANEYALALLDSLSYADIYESSLYELVKGHMAQSFTFTKVSKYTSVTMGGSLFD